MKKYYCCNCGYVVFEYDHQIKYLFEGRIVEEALNSIDVQCSHCKVMFHIFV